MNNLESLELIGNVYGGDPDYAYGWSASLAPLVQLKALKTITVDSFDVYDREMGEQRIIATLDNAFENLFRFFEKNCILEMAASGQMVERNLLQVLVSRAVLLHEFTV